MKKIIFTGGSGKFGKIFKKINFNKKNIYYPSSNTFDITNIRKMEKFIKKIKKLTRIFWLDKYVNNY